MIRDRTFQSVTRLKYRENGLNYSLFVPYTGGHALDENKAMEN